MTSQKFVKKSWGWELWFANVQDKDGPDYCGKILFVEHDKWSSYGKYHYHDIKDETFFVVEGELHLAYVDANGVQNRILFPHDSFRIKPGVKHKFTSAIETGCKFIEVSTFHSDADSYRGDYNPDTKEWIDA